MHTFRFQRAARLTVLFPIVAILGCDSTPVTAWSMWPWGSPERVRYDTPGDRIERIDAMGEKAASAPPHDQHEMAAGLAVQIQKETDPVVREHMVRTLAKLDDPTATAVVRAGLEDTSVDVRIACCEGLSYRDGVETVAALAEVVHSDDDIDVRLAATRALENHRRPEAVRALAIALEDPDPALQLRAVRSLRRVTGLDYGNDVGRWLEFARKGELPPERPVTLAERMRRAMPF